MPSIHDLKTSSFLTKEDCGKGILCTVRGYEQKNVAKEGATPEMKWVLYFNEQEKGLVLNNINGQIIAGFTGSEDFDGWIGKKVVLYHDPNVSFGGKLIGGIRVRAPRVQQTAPAPAAKPAPVKPAAPAPPAEPEPAEPVDDDVPF